MSRTDTRWLELARKIAESSDMNKRHGAVVVKSGRVLSTGVNKFRNSVSIIETHNIKRHCSVHAEVDALSRVADARGATIYVARVNRMNQERMSRPCNHCYTAIVRAGINKIVYTTGDV